MPPYRPVQHQALLQGLWDRLARSINKPTCYRQQIIHALTTVLSHAPDPS